MSNEATEVGCISILFVETDSLPKLSTHWLCKFTLSLDQRPSIAQELRLQVGSTRTMRTALVIDPRTCYRLNTQSAKGSMFIAVVFLFPLCIFFLQEEESHCNSERPIIKPALCLWCRVKRLGLFLWVDLLFQLSLPRSHHTFVSTGMGAFSMCSEILDNILKLSTRLPCLYPSQKFYTVTKPADVNVVSQ